MKSDFEKIKKPKRCQHFITVRIGINHVYKKCHECGARWKAKIGKWRKVK